MTIPDVVVASIAMVIAMSAALSAMVDTRILLRWSVANRIYQRFGSRGVRWFFAILAFLMGLIAFKLLWYPKWPSARSPVHVANVSLGNPTAGLKGFEIG